MGELLNNSTEITSIKRRIASSGNVSFSDSIVIHDTSKTQIKFVPFYITRSTGSELAIKIVTYKKQPPPMDWMVVEEKSISLREEASRSLLKALKEHLAIAENDGDGDYIAIKLTEKGADIEGFDPETVSKAIVSMLNREDILKHLSMSDLSKEMINAFKTSIRLQELKNGVAQLRQYLEEGVTLEQIYQEWCEGNSWAFGNSYVVRDNVRQIAPGDSVDLLFPTVAAGFRDLIELKRPNMDVLRFDSSHKNYYFSSEVSKAIGQCHRYLDVLNEEAANGLRDYPEVVAYFPRATIVIGRSIGWDEVKLKALHGLNNRLSGISVMTYDQLLLQGERLIELFEIEDQDHQSEIDDVIDGEHDDTWDDN